MLVKCEKCGYENFPQHRYCGMCAAELRLPAAAGTQPAARPPRVTSPVEPPLTAAQNRDFVVPRKEAPIPPKAPVSREVSGPSFLGLGAEPAENKNFSYLLEDDTPKHRGRNVILFLLLAGAAAGAWHWRQDLRVIADRVTSTLPATKTDGSGNQQPTPATPAPDATSAAAPASTANAVTPVEKPGDTAQPPAQTPSSAVPAATASGTADSTQPAQTDQSPPANSPQASEAATTPAAKLDEAPAPPAPARKAETTRAQRAAASASQADDLEAQGEKYLYGNGVPENCARARTNLLAAAEHSNAQAQSVLGTMYATGHCATRDLPTAYRWFGRSLRQDPKNTRLEQDLRVLWNQMTPGERQMALRSER
jgi:hypothetical protein